jgi:putative two-component system response regulator
LQLADVYDALTTDRPYRTAVPSDAALSLMDEEAIRGWWDVELFNTFRDMIRESNPAVAPRSAHR